MVGGWINGDLEATDTEWAMGCAISPPIIFLHTISYYQLLSRLQGIIPALFQLFPLWHLEYSRGSAEVQVAEGQRSNLMGVSQNWGYPTSAISNILVNRGIFGFKFRDKPISCQYVPISWTCMWASSLLDICRSQWPPFAGSGGVCQ